MMTFFSEYNALTEAIKYADAKHNGQERKYTGTPYITHPLTVLLTLQHFGYPLNADSACASVLHDVVEDTDATFEDITEVFGKDVSKIVYYCSHVAKPEDGNRKVRVDKNISHYLMGTFDSYAIKVADAIHNCESIMEYDKGFYYKYIKEKYLLIENIQIKVNGDYSSGAVAIKDMIEYFKQKYTSE